ncbi:heme-dependent oxidative N-demethylase family protein [Jannaschia marina]|uniref:heme-dependent oxidative N-demethylase family protein n=1 Tax=Jannaschia marina TaxID=2741674 RepID=UPI0015C78EDB|nr:DUF3445 domain-containing protein [Jannaschia marina]
MTGQGAPILQSHLPFTPWSDPGLARMPGMVPVEGNWIVVDDAYARQMALRRRLLNDRPDDVLHQLPQSGPAVEDLREVVLAALPEGFARTEASIRCPDGVEVATGGDALKMLGRLLQEDLLLLLPDGGEHVLVAGLLCFPASWTLAEKIGRPLTRIHAPVPDYDTGLATRVQRMFDRLPAGRAMWRANALGYADAALHQPHREATPREDGDPVRYLRCERQTVLRLPRTGALLFAVHTYVVTPDRLTDVQRAGCPIIFGE